MTDAGSAGAPKGLQLDGTLAQTCKAEELGGGELDWGAEVCRELSDGGEERGLSSPVSKLNSAKAVVLTSQGMARSVSGARRAPGRRRQKLCSHQTLGASHDFHYGPVQERNSLPLTRLVSRITVRRRLHLLRH